MGSKVLKHTQAHAFFFTVKVCVVIVTIFSLAAIALSFKFSLNFLILFSIFHQLIC
jgi:hypothetical protein